MKASIIGLVINLLILSMAVAEIYKWKDDSGQIHYGSQCPHDACSPVKQLPFTSNSPVLLPDTNTELSPDGNVGSKTEPTNAPKPVSRSIVNPGECLDSIADTLGKGRVDPHEPIEPVEPSVEQYRVISHFLNQLSGFWHGTMIEEICKGSVNKPDSEQIIYSVMLEIINDLKGNFNFESVERSQNNIVRQTNVKILINRDKLHAGESRGWIDGKRWAVKLLGAKHGELVLLRQFRTRGRQGGSLQQMILRAYYYDNNQLTISEYYYTQDKLVRIRTSTLKR